MAIQESEPKVRPSAWWYLLVVVLWVAAAILAILTVKPIIDVFTSDVHPVSNGGQIDVPDDGITIYSTRNVNSTACDLTDSAGNATALDAFDNGDEFDFDAANGPHVYAVGVTPDDFPAGTYTLTCQRPAGSDFYSGKRVDFVEIGTRFLVGFGGGGLLGLAGLIVLIVLLVRRHNAKSRIRQYQAAYGYPASYGQYGSPSGYQAPGTYPPPGGYPPPTDYPQQGTGTYPPSYPGQETGESPPPPPPPPPPPSYPPPDDDGTGSSTGSDDNPPRT
jgi:hypothetical protein